MTIIIRSIFSKNGKFYPQLFLYEALYEFIKMLRYQKIDISERIDINKTNASKECEVCHYWFFKDIGFEFEEHVVINAMIY